MTPDILHLTEAGQQAIANADVGGLLVNPRTFRIGEFTSDDPDQFFIDNGIPSSLQGNVIYTGTISYVQVLDRNTVRFTLDIPQNIPADLNLNDDQVPSVGIGELLVQLEDGTSLGYCLYSKPFSKRANESVRIEVLLHVSSGDSHTVNVTLSEFGSIPNVMSVADLPSPVSALANAVGVNDLSINNDGSTSPGIAHKFGPGGAHWGYGGHTRIYNGDLLGGTVDNAAIFRLDQAINDGNLLESTTVIVQVLQGDGAGETRKFTTETDGSGLQFRATNTAFTNLSENSVISIWKPIESGTGSSCPWPPGGEDVPSHWVLQRGIECPQWVDPLRSQGQGTTLYHPPGSLKVTAHILAPEDVAGNRTFIMYQKDLSIAQSEKAQIHRYSHTKNNNYAYISLSGATQHREAFEITENVIEFAEELPDEVQIDARLFRLDPSAGALLNVRYSETPADGTRTIFDIPIEADETITSPEQCFVFVDPFLQAINAYTIDIENKQIVFVTAPPTGVIVETNAFVTTQVNGYATHIHTQNYLTRDLTRVLQLPFTPQDKGLVFISEQGLHVNRSLYNIVDDRVIFRRDIDPDREVEVMIFRNILSEGSPDQSIRGVITDAVTTSKSIELIRHNAERIRIPVPKFEVQGGSGITVRGSYPNFVIESDLAQTIALDNPVNFNNQFSEEDAEEIIYTTRVEFKGDVIVRATADFSCKLGPGFGSDDGLESMQFVLGYKTHSQNEPEYARNIKGTGEAGFSVVAQDKSDTYAYGSSSVTQSWTIKASNNPSGFIDIVAKMRVRNARVSDYSSLLKTNLDVQVTPSLVG
jgi:hypothetical protein